MRTVVITVEAFPSYISILVFIARLTLGVIFLSSSLGKLHRSSSFVQGVINYRILPAPIVHRFGFILPWIELLLALALLIGVELLVAGVATILLLLCFTVVVVVNLRRHRLVSCNCDGIIGTKVIGWGTIARNCLLLVVAMPLFIADTPTSLPAIWRTDLAIILDLVSSLLTVLLVIFCIVFLLLVEWSVNLSTIDNWS